LPVVAAAVVLCQKCLHVNKPYGLACAKVEFGELVLAAVADAIITKECQILCIGHVTCAIVLDVVNMMFAVEQHLKNGLGTMYIQYQVQERPAKV
jgi:hypothetical protein